MISFFEITIGVHRRGRTLDSRYTPFWRPAVIFTGEKHIIIGIRSGARPFENSRVQRATRSIITPCWFKYLIIFSLPTYRLETRGARSNGWCKIRKRSSTADIIRLTVLLDTVTPYRHALNSSRTEGFLKETSSYTTTVIMTPSVSYLNGRMLMFAVLSYAAGTFTAFSSVANVIKWAGVLWRLVLVATNNYRCTSCTRLQPMPTRENDDKQVRDSGRGHTEIRAFDFVFKRLLNDQIYFSSIIFPDVWNDVRQWFVNVGFGIQQLSTLRSSTVHHYWVWYLTIFNILVLSQWKKHLLPLSSGHKSVPVWSRGWRSYSKQYEFNFARWHVRSLLCTCPGDSITI